MTAKVTAVQHSCTRTCFMAGLAWFAPLERQDGVLRRILASGIYIRCRHYVANPILDIHVFNPLISRALSDTHNGSIRPDHLLHAYCGFYLALLRISAIC